MISHPEAPSISSRRISSSRASSRRIVNPACVRIFFVSVLVIWTLLLGYLGLSGNSGVIINQELEKISKDTKDGIKGLRRREQKLEEQMKQAVDSAFEAAQRAFRLQQHQQKLMKDGEVTKNTANSKKAMMTSSHRFDDKQRKGFVVLGMHRSGTSMLSGLLVKGMGYNVGKPLIEPAFDNEKGFFELLPIVLQNDEFMSKQNVGWSYNVLNFDYKKALEQKKLGKVKFKEGQRGLPFLNDPKNAPWLQKDPRMCITLKTWLELLNSEPAVIYTYRHPLEVAHSLEHREGFDVEHGLRLWIAYNMRALQNSLNLCIVYSSNEKLLANPKDEVQRLSHELVHKCNVPAPPNELTQDAVDIFVDPKLQHEKKKKKNEDGILDQYGDCVVPKYESKFGLGSRKQLDEEKMYRIAMKIFCDLKSGAAYSADYEWPALV